jgi:hypothetical protein
MVYWSTQPEIYINWMSTQCTIMYAYKLNIYMRLTHVQFCLLCEGCTYYCLQWKTVIRVEGLIILHVIHAVQDLKFNI